MSIDDFWYNDESLFETYAKAFLYQLDTKAWLQGFYFTKALESSILTYMPLAVAQGSGLSKAKYEPILYPTSPLNSFSNSSTPSQELSEDAKREQEWNMMQHWI